MDIGVSNHWVVNLWVFPCEIQSKQNENFRIISICFAACT